MLEEAEVVEQPETITPLVALVVAALVVVIIMQMQPLEQPTQAEGVVVRVALMLPLLLMGPQVVLA